MVKVRFMTLTGKFTTKECREFTSESDAKQAIREYASANGFTNVKEVSEEDYEIRFTATTPGNRAGRNIAYLEMGW